MCIGEQHTKSNMFQSDYAHDSEDSAVAWVRNGSAHGQRMWHATRQEEQLWKLYHCCELLHETYYLPHCANERTRAVWHAKEANDEIGRIRSPRS